MKKTTQLEKSRDTERKIHKYPVPSCDLLFLLDSRLFDLQPSSFPCRGGDGPAPRPNDCAAVVPL